MIKEVNYERVFNLGNYENHRIGCVVVVENGDHIAAFIEARAAVEAQHANFEQEREAERNRIETEWARKRQEQIDAIRQRNDEEDEEDEYPGKWA